MVIEQHADIKRTYWSIKTNIPENVSRYLRFLITQYNYTEQNLIDSGYEKYIHRRIKT